MRRACLILLLVLASALAAMPATAVSASPGSGLATCTIVGTSGPDRLVGTPGRDVICGLAGNDTLIGRGGRDVLRGDGGRDRLVGGAGADDLRGGPGRNTCVPDHRDTRTCYVDRQVPELLSTWTSADSVDVTDATRTVEVRVRLRDDLAIGDGDRAPYVNLYSFETRPQVAVRFQRLRLVSGTVREGVWSTRVRIARGFPATRLTIELHAVDRARHGLARDTGRRVIVEDREPDTELPQVVSQRPTSGSTVDTRSSGAVTAQARIVDGESGVETSPTFCLEPTVGALGLGPCAPARLVSGTRRDGVWRATIKPGRDGFETGDVCLSVRVTDAAHPGAAVGTTCRSLVGTRYGVTWARAGGEHDWFTIRGTAADSAPRLVAYRQPSSTSVCRFELDLADDHGIRGVDVYAMNADAQPEPSVSDSTQLVLTDGTAADGTWTGEISGYVGTYPIVVRVYDRGHVRTYAGATIAGLLDEPTLPLEGDPACEQSPAP